MSFLSVLFGRGKNSDAPTVPAVLERDGHARDASAGAAKSSAAAPAVARADGKTGVDAERADRRERLYRVVRETLMRCGVLSASYKFKVLSTDARGLQFLVMLDVASDAAQLMRFAEIEAIIRQAAKDQYDIDVIAVYSRINAQLAPRATQLQAAARGEPAYAQPVPAFNVNSNRHAVAFGLGQPMAPPPPPPAQSPAPARAGGGRLRHDGRTGRTLRSDPRRRSGCVQTSAGRQQPAGHGRRRAASLRCAAQIGDRLRGHPGVRRKPQPCGRGPERHAVR